MLMYYTCKCSTAGQLAEGKPNISGRELEPLPLQSYWITHMHTTDAAFTNVWDQPLISIVFGLCQLLKNHVTLILNRFSTIQSSAVLANTRYNPLDSQLIQDSVSYPLYFDGAWHVGDWIRDTKTCTVLWWNFTVSTQTTVGAGVRMWVWPEFPLHCH